MNERLFFRVTSDLRNLPIDDHLQQGYESKWEFYSALRELVRRWHGRVGERVGERHGFYRLCFHDTPGRVPDKVWLPAYLLLPAPAPEEADDLEGDETTRELDAIHGFD